MNLQENLIALDSAVDKLSQGINAIELMSMGLVQMQDPYADGLFMLANYMIETDREVRIHLDACLKAMQEIIHLPERQKDSIIFPQ